MKTLVQMIFFVIGTGLVFSVIGVICALTGKMFVGNPYFALVIASVILIMGLKIVGVIDFNMPVIIKEIPKIILVMILFTHYYWVLFLH